MQHADALTRGGLSRSVPKRGKEFGPRSLPVICGFLVATICFSAARIHASGSVAFVDRSVDQPAISTRLVEFRPQDFAPAAFADWADPPSTN